MPLDKPLLCCGAKDVMRDVEANAAHQRGLNFSRLPSLLTKG